MSTDHRPYGPWRVPGTVLSKLLRRTPARTEWPGPVRFGNVSRHVVVAEQIRQATRTHALRILPLGIGSGRRQRRTRRLRAQDAGLFMSACNGGSGAFGIAEFDGFTVTSG